MDFITSLYIRAREAHSSRSRGQAMTEYALILGAVAVVVFAVYQTMGTDIGKLVNKINTDLTVNAS
jgi:Flp pilus assembly pilin Flp